MINFDDVVKENVKERIQSVHKFLVIHTKY